MKPFDLEAAKAGAKVITRDGKPARIVCFDRKHIKSPIIALVSETDHEEELRTYSVRGWYFQSTECGLDLFMAPEKKEGWINIYSVGGFATGLHKTKAEADENASTNRVACIHIEWEE